MTKHIEKDLLSLGLGSNEARVYLSLIEQEKKKAGEIIKETGLHRNLVYQALEELTKRRLITKTTQSGVFHFQVTDPEHFRDSLREQELVASRVIEELKDRSKLSDQEITIYEGEDAIRTFTMKMARSLSPGERIHVLGSATPRFENSIGLVSFQKYFQTIDERGGGIRILMYAHQSYSASLRQAQEKYAWMHVRQMPIDVTSAANVVFTDTIVAFQIFEKPQSVIEIRNPHLVSAYKNYFELLWNQNVRVEHGIDALRNAFIEMIDELKPGEEYRVLGGNLGPEYRRMTDFFDEIHRYRISRGVIANILAQSEAAENIRERNRRVGDPEEKISHTKTFHTPFLAPMQINMVNGRAYLVLYKKDAPTMIFFEDPTVYQGFKLYFDEIWNRQTETLTGKQGVMDLCERVLEKGKAWYVIAAQGFVSTRYADAFKQITTRRLEKRIPLHLLATERADRHQMNETHPTSIHYLPEGFASPMVIWIFGDTVAHVLWHEPETIFLIQDEKTAEYYRNYFEALKNSSTR